MKQVQVYIKNPHDKHAQGRWFTLSPIQSGLTGADAVRIVAEDVKCLYPDHDIETNCVSFRWTGPRTGIFRDVDTYVINGLQEYSIPA